MGKKLIFKDVDFSANALEVPGNYTDITSLFTFTNSKAYKANPEATGVGTLVESTTFRSASANVSAYAGKTIKIAFCSFTATGGGASGYGNVAKDSGGNVITSNGCWPFPKYGSTGPALSLYYTEITLPSNANTLCVTYAQTSKIPAGGLQFACYVKD